ncbi:MAG: PadR family transcriptional regulator [Actinomycetia bacterium]|nr:PadR family transcriptional regulator [Actinomycetes bacterium]
MPAKLAVLGLLVEQPLHGYGVERLIEQRGMRKWTSVGFSSIYQILDQLVDEGLASVEIVPAPGRGKQRRLHSPTAAGRRLWVLETTAALATVADTDEGFLTAFSCLPLLDPGVALEALERRLANLDAGIAALDHDRSQVGPVPDFIDAMFGYTRTRLLAARAWLVEFLSTLSTPKETQP